MFNPFIELYSTAFGGLFHLRNIFLCFRRTIFTLTVWARTWWTHLSHARSPSTPSPQSMATSLPTFLSPPPVFPSSRPTFTSTGNRCPTWLRVWQLCKSSKMSWPCTVWSTRGPWAFKNVSSSSSSSSNNNNKSSNSSRVTTMRIQSQNMLWNSGDKHTFSQLVRKELKQYT